MIVKSKTYSFETTLLTNRRKKKGLLLYLQLQSGQSSWGEISPLESWSTETFEQALDELSEEKEKLLGCEPQQALHALLQNDTLLPSVSFGLFGALTGFDDKPNLASLVSGLLYGSYEEIMQQIPYIKSQKFSHVKLKTSKLTPSQGFDIVSHLSEISSIRIDVNSAWSKKDLETFLYLFPTDRFEYIEDPCLLTDELNTFSFPFAIDEALRKNFSTDILKAPNLKAFVIKPSLMGVGPKVQELFTLAQQKGLMISLSSSFETGVGLQQIARLSDFFKLPSAPMGLDTYRFLSPDILLQRHTLCHSRMSFAPIIPDMKQLSEVVYA